MCPSCSRRLAGEAAITLSQVDPGVLHELPDDLRREVLAQLQQQQQQQGGFPASKAQRRGGAAARLRSRLADPSWSQGEGSGRLGGLGARGPLDEEDAASQGGSEAEGGSDAEGSAGPLPLPAAAAEFVAAMRAAELGPREVEGRLEACLREIRQEAAEEGSGGETEVDSPGGSGALGGQEGGPSQPASAAPPALRHAATALAKSVGAAARRAVPTDLARVRGLLLLLQRLGQRHSWFAEAGAAAVQGVQRRVQRRYGHPLTLWRLL